MTTKMARRMKAAAVVLVALGAGYALLLGLSSRALRRAYDDLRRAGRAMQARDVIPAPVPDADNAALLYEAAVLRLRSERAGEKALLERLAELADSTNAPAMDEELRGLLQTPAARDALELIREGAARLDCRHDLDYGKGAGLLLPHLAGLRTLSRIMAAQVRLSAETNAAAAWADARAGLRLANALRSEPLLISQLVRVAQLGRAVEAVQTLAAEAAPSEEDRVRVRAELAAFDDAQAWPRAVDADRILLGEWAFALPPSELQNMTATGDSIGGAVLLRLCAAFRPAMQADHAAYLRIMGNYASGPAATFSRERSQQAEQAVQGAPWYALMTRLIAPALGRTHERLLTMVALARVTDTGLAVLQHRQETGAYPARLTVLAPGRTLDPFSGGELLYAADANGFVLRSVGPDGEEDAAAEAKSPGHRPDDIVWRCAAP